MKRKRIVNQKSFVELYRNYPFNKKPLREQWRQPNAKRSLVGFLVTFGFIRNPELTDGNGD